MLERRGSQFLQNFYCSRLLVYSLHCLPLLQMRKQIKNNFQENDGIVTAFELPFYKTLGDYMTLIGVNPFQDNKVSLARLIPLVVFCFTGFTPMYIRLWQTFRNRDFDGLFEDAPQALTALISIVKVLNVYSNKSRFQYLFNYIIRGRELMKSPLEMSVLDKVTNDGTTLATIYRKCLWFTVTLFIFLSMYNPIVDVIAPLNETRPRQHLFHVNYLFLDEMENFWPVFVHLSMVAYATVIIIVTIDSLYIIVIYHACGMFAACGRLVQNATEDTVENQGGTIDANGYKEYNRCINVHYEALQFYDVLDICCRNSYLIQMGINMIVVSTTAVELVMFFDRPADVVRLACYLAAQLFHLYMISLPGQRLLEQSVQVVDKVWFSRWYEIPVRAQKMLILMVLRANRPCILTAAGLYQMTIESFGITVKACMSYFTMFLSVRD